MNELTPLEPSKPIEITATTYDLLMESITDSTLLIKDKNVLVVDLNVWNKIMETLKAFDKKLDELRMNPPINGASGACETLGCQWNILKNNRIKYNNQAESFESICLIAEETLKMVDTMAERELLSVAEWWTKQSAELRRKIEDCRRVL